MEGYYFSVFAMTDELYIKVMTGVKYPLADYVMTGSFPIGVSNEITDADAVLDITDGLALVVRSKM
jgi:thiamine pyrophosphokinase